MGFVVKITLCLSVVVSQNNFSAKIKSTWIPEWWIAKMTLCFFQWHFESKIQAAFCVEAKIISSVANKISTLTYLFQNARTGFRFRVWTPLLLLSENDCALVGWLGSCRFNLLPHACPTLKAVYAKICLSITFPFSPLFHGTSGNTEASLS